MTARAADGTIEAIEDPERPFWLGVQWHPENGDDHGLFRGLVEAAAASGSPPAAELHRVVRSPQAQAGSTRWRAGSSSAKVRTGPGGVSRVSNRTVTRPRPEPQTQPRPCSSWTTSAPGRQPAASRGVGADLLLSLHLVLDGLVEPSPSDLSSLVG